MILRESEKFKIVIFCFQKIAQILRTVNITVSFIYAIIQEDEYLRNEIQSLYQDKRVLNRKSTFFSE